MIEGGAAIEIECVIARTGEDPHAVGQRENRGLAQVRLVIGRAHGSQVRRRHRERMAVDVLVVGGHDGSGLQVADHHGIRLIQEDSRVIDSHDGAEVRHEGRVRAQHVLEDEIDLHVRIPIQTA